MIPDKRLLRRLYLLIVIVGLWSVAIGARLCFLQVVESSSYREDAARQQQLKLKIPPVRGVIMDRNGKMLAGSDKVESVFADPREISNIGSTAAALARITGISTAELVERLTEPNAKFVWIQRKVSRKMKEEIEQIDLPGIHFREETRRLYPGKALAAPLLGYVDLDGKGISGLEYRYNKQLAGEEGNAVVLRDARKKTFQRITQEPVAGAALTTTIDERIQYIVEKEIEAAAPMVRKTGGIAIAAMNPRTGEILAMANYPTFNPNDYGKSRDADRINRAVHQVYEPGSTFKILTMMAALEEGLTTPDERIDCQMGSILVAGHRIKDHKPFGVLSSREIMQFSSDVGAIKLGMRLGNDRLYDYMVRLGFGRKTGIDLPGEEVGIVRPTSKWSKISIGAVSMGQEVGVTPLQILSLVSSVANGGMLYRPYVVEKVEHPQDGIRFQAEPSGKRVMSELTAKQLQEMLEGVVAEGTAKASRPEGYRAAGKTGTAQKIDETKHYSTTKYVASFAGYAPASNPSVAVIVVVDEPVGAYHGGEVAAPIFKRIVEQILRYRSIPPDAPDYAPHYTVAPARPAPPLERVMPQAKDWAVVKAAVAAAATPVTPSAELSVGEVVVPDFRGKSLRFVTAETLKLGIRLRSYGSGQATAQEPPPDARLKAGAVLEVLFDGAP